MENNENISNEANMGNETSENKTNVLLEKGVESAKHIAEKATDAVGKAASDAVGTAGKAAMGAAGKAVKGALLPLLLKIGLPLLLVGGIGFGVKIAFDSKKPLTIEDTANVISEIKKIGEYTTACYYEEMAMRDERIDTTYYVFGNYTTSKSEIVILGKGWVRAGFDLGKIGENDLKMHGDTLDIVLPPAEIFDIIMNPSDFTTEYEVGKWSHENTKPMKVQAKQQLEKDALEFGLLAKATTSGQSRLKNLFAVFGFNTINMTIKE